MKAKENALRIIRFDHPERVVSGPPTHELCYYGVNHEGFAGGGHESPVGARWVDIWGTGWHKEIESVLETLMRLGVDILNPLQATANDLAKVRAATRGRMALRGGVSSATIMEGPVDRIAAEVRERIWQLGQQGGYFCGPDQGLPYPQAHLDALSEAVDRFGRYPLRLTSR